MQRITKSLFIIIFSLLLAITLFAGCEMTTKVDSDKSDISNPPDDDDTSDEFLILSIKEGNFQAGTIEESFAKPLTVIASNEDGSPVSGLSVSFFTPLGLDEGKGEVFVSPGFFGNERLWRNQLHDFSGKQNRDGKGCREGVARN